MFPTDFYPRARGAALRWISVLCTLLISAALVLIVINHRPKLVSGKAAPRSSRPHSATPSEKSRVAARYGTLPLSFEANGGQADAQVQFLSRGSHHTLFLTADAAVIWLSGGSSSGLRRVGDELNGAATDSQQALEILRLKLMGANQAARVTPLDELPGNVNYFLGNDPSEWRIGIPTYAKVKYASVYPGVDLVYYGNQGHLEFDFAVAPGGDPKAIRLSLAEDSPRHGGIDPSLRIAANGDLLIETNGGEVRLHKPVVYQPAKKGPPFLWGGILGHWAVAMDHQQQARNILDSPFRTQGSEFVDARYALFAKNEVGFSLEGYDPTQPLVIDPVLSYSTYLGGDAEPGGQPSAVAVDGAGNAYITGSGWIPDLPTTAAAFQPACAQTSIGGCALNGFVAKLNPEGTALLYATYLGGGTGQTFMHALAVDSSGNAYLTGGTSATDYPTTPGSYQPHVAPHVSIASTFVTKLNPEGTGLDYSTYFSDGGVGNAITVDAFGSAYISGSTFSLDFPTTVGAFQTSCKNPVTAACNGSAFVTKFNAQGSALEYSTYFGTSGGTGVSVAGIAVDPGGDAYITGGTDSADFPTTPGAFQTIFVGGQCQFPPTPTGPVGNYTCPDAFVTKLNATGSSLVYSTFLAGSKSDGGVSIAVDAIGNAYVAGSTDSPDYPTSPGAFQGSSGNIFVTKLNPAGSALVYSTRLGGSQSDSVAGIAVDTAGDAYVAGQAVSTDFPTVNPLQAQSAGGNGDAFVSVFNPVGTKLLFSTYLGGSSDDGAYGIGVDASGNAYITGHTDSVDFPVSPNALKTSSQVVCQAGTSPSVGYSAPCGSMFVTKLALGLGGSAGDFSLSASPTATNIAAGQRASFTLKITPTGGFNRGVDLGCAGAPQAATCTVSPSSTTMTASAAATATVAVTTTARSVAGRYKGPTFLPPTLGFRPWTALLWIWGLVAVVSLCLAGSRRLFLRRAWPGLLALALLAVLFGTMACGGSNMVSPPGGSGDPGTPQGAYTITVTGTSTSGSVTLTHDITFALSVQ